MRILACADLHGRPARVARVRALVAEHRPDVLCLAGDLTHAGSGSGALQLLETLDVPIVAVSGNMDDAHTVEAMRRRGVLLGDSPRVIGGVTFAGPEVAGPCDVLVTHEPPAGVLDRVGTGRHIGSPAVRALIERWQPRLHVCGHVHESPGVVRLGATTVVNCTLGRDEIAGALAVLEGEALDVRLLPP
ncbi:MAG: metallophosphoesterase [Armatimonadota bacterium]|nr:metallophosphoesterase [Armatimonadota bacterium]MDR7459732.1 metallophosphoesterase [Armatimonadota bacterium]MDR7478609.1 metallophosphoesterase [Armatimonadota bacterium]MDR7488413.1 metallophosphoesterase [Armatimonadota bacterium]MDR7500890.1 metallophosphoesterase [Armatimonadota bacterium]